jgi:hypothetical protein
MSTKKKLMERIGRRMDMIQESLPPEVLFTDMEVLSMLNEIDGFNPKTVEDVYKDNKIVTTKFKIEEIFRRAIRKKRGLPLDGSGEGHAPEGAYY